MKNAMMTVCAAVASMALTAGIVEETKSQPVLAGTAQMASLGDVTQKVTSLGTLVGNPIVPTLLLTPVQQQLVEKYGRLRADVPLTWFAYVQTPAWEIAATNMDQVAIEDMFERVIVYPIADGPANMLLKHPGATKAADGTIHILPSEGNPDDMYVKYTEDSRYCAFASSPALAAKALTDFAALSANRNAGKDSPLLRVEIAERGVTAMATMYDAIVEEQKKAMSQAGTNDVAGIAASLQGSNQRKVRELLASIASCTLTLDVDKSGLTLATSLQPRHGRKIPFASDFSLPKDALNHVPATAPIFYLSGDRLAAQCSDEATYRADMAAIGNGMTAFLSEAAKDGDCVKYKTFLKDFGSALSNMLNAFPFPDATDWTGLWVAFDGKAHPSIGGVRQAVKAEKARECSRMLNKSLVAAVEKQWPGKKLLVESADSITLDLSVLVDLIAADAGVKPGDKDAKELENAKKTIAKILGGDKLCSTNRYEGNMYWMQLSAHAVKPAGGEAPATGEMRVAAAMPEATARRPAAVFSMELYTLVRNGVLPIMASISDKQDAKQYNAIITAMPPPEANSAIVCATWTDAKGSLSSLLRITAGELKNLGAAFNAFTAASLIGADND